MSLYEIELVQEKGGISFIGNKQFPVEAGLVICAKPGQLRHTKLPFRCKYIHFITSDGVLTGALGCIPSAFVLPSHDKREKLETLMDSVATHLYSGTEHDDILMYAKMLEIIYFLCKEARHTALPTGTAAPVNPAVIKAIEYIDGHYTAPLPLKLLSDEIHLSQTHFLACFKAATGKTPHEYILEKKLKKAAGLLVSTDMTLTEIAYECGFSSQSYFSYAFKNKFGVTPREYVRDVYDHYGSAWQTP